MLLHAGGDGEDVRIKNNVLRREADFPCQQIVRARANLDAALGVVGLALFVERHHHHRRTVAADQSRLFDKRLLAFLEAYRVDYSFALQTLEACLNDGPFRAVDHDRHARDIRLGGDQIQKPHHRRLGVEHALVHVDVDYLRAVLDLLPRNRERVLVLIVLDQLGKAR